MISHNLTLFIPHSMITLIEPQRWKDILTWLNHWVSSNPSLFHVTSISADIFVFSYPVILIFMYFYGYIKHKKDYQLAGISILISWIVSISINLIIQLFIRKARPETLPWLELILSHVPTISFPSDHAAISMAIAVGFFLQIEANRGEQRRTNSALLLFRLLAFSLFIFSIIMWISRIAVAIHRPTDILAWWIIWIIWGRIGRKLCYTPLWIKAMSRMIGIGNSLVSFLLPARFRS